MNEDLKGNNTIHIAVQLEKIQFLSFLLEGTFESELEEISRDKFQNVSEEFIDKKAQELYAVMSDKKSNKPWIFQSLKALDVSNS